MPTLILQLDGNPLFKAAFNIITLAELSVIITLANYPRNTKSWPKPKNPERNVFEGIHNSCKYEL